MIVFVRYTLFNAMKNRSNSAALHREPLAAEKGRAKRDEYGLERHTEISAGKIRL